MSNFDFSVEEINFICIYCADTKDETLSAIYDVMPSITDKGMLAVGESVINKLTAMSDEEFTEYNFKEILSE